METKVADVYVALDGKEFVTKQECVDYEEGLKDAWKLSELTEKLDDFIMAAYYARKAGLSYSIDLKSFLLSDGKRYTPYNDGVYRALKEVANSRGATLEYTEPNNDYGSPFYRLWVREEKYEEFLETFKNLN